MKFKSILTAVLLGFVVLSLGYSVYAGAKDRNGARGAEARTPTGEAVAEGPVTYVYYFHGTQRCPTCISIEENTLASVEAAFAAELGRGSLRFESHDIDTPEDAHFAKDFELVSSGVVLAHRGGGAVLRYQHLPEVWPLAHEPEELRAYIARELRAFLAGPSS
jgi:hypothetical protein